MWRILILFLCAQVWASALAHSPEYKSLHVVWLHSFYSDTISTEFLLPTLMQDHVLFCSRFEPLDVSPGVAIYEKSTGKKHQGWQVEAEKSLPGVDFINDYAISSDEKDLYIANEGALYAFDMQTGKKMWEQKYKPPYTGGIRMGFVEDRAIAFITDEALARNEGWACQYSSNDGKCDTLFSLMTEDDFEFAYGKPSVCVDNNSDTLLLFQTRAWNYSESKPRTVLYAYNLSQKKMKWDSSLLKNEWEGTSNAPLVYENNIAIFPLSGKVIAVEIESGAVLWIFDAFADNNTKSKERHPKNNANSTPYSSSTTPLTLSDNQLFLRLDDGYIYSINPQNGNVIWKTDVLYPPATLNNIECYNNNLYFTGHDLHGIALFCISQDNGAFQWSSYGPTGRVNGGIAIDKKTGMLYAASNQFVFCVNIND